MNKNNVKNLKIGVAILAGGSGTRLWPLSNPDNPKPFIQLKNIGSLYDNAVERAFSLKPELVVTIASEKLIGFCKRENVELLIEPCPKNTAPAVALAAMYLKEKIGEGSVLVVLPADHYIPDKEKFSERFLKLAEISRKYDGFGLMGISPTYPATGYGYIEMGEEIENGYKVLSFREKPDYENAKKMVESKRFLWNSGMFSFPIDVLLKEMEKHCPQYVNGAREYIENKNDKTFFKLKPDSIDYALMEKATNVFVIKCDFNWSDVGNYKSLYEILDKDENGNVIIGNPKVENCKNSLIIADREDVIVREIESMVFVSLKEGALATPIEKCEGIKKMVEEILKGRKG